jgi:hypothetical protein
MKTLPAFNVILSKGMILGMDDGLFLSIKIFGLIFAQV